MPAWVTLGGPSPHPPRIGWRIRTGAAEGGSGGVGGRSRLLQRTGPLELKAKSGGHAPLTARWASHALHTLHTLHTLHRLSVRGMVRSMVAGRRIEAFGIVGQAPVAASTLAEPR